jgi:hypothetical protein
MTPRQTPLITALCLMALLTTTPLLSQVIYFGVKAGPQLSWMRSDDRDFRELVRSLPRPGFSAGGVVSFKVKDRYFLHTEYLFSTKGKVNRGKVDKVLEDRITYNYIEVPMLYNIQFHERLAGGRQFKLYAGAGPLFSYWLGGHGWINSDEFEENSFPPISYKMRFGSRGEDLGETNIVYMHDVKRFQLGFNLGGGVLLEPANAGKIMADLRLELGHTWMGTPGSADYVLPVTYDDSLQGRNMSLRFSLMYLFEKNLDKEVRNKGKSNLKQKGNTIRKKK